MHDKKENNCCRWENEATRSKETLPMTMTNLISKRSKYRINMQPKRGKQWNT